MYRWTLVKIVCYRLGTRVQIYDTIGLFTDKYKVYILSLYFCILNFLFQIRILNEPSGLSRFLHILLKTWALSEGSFHFISFRRNILCYWCLHIHLKKIHISGSHITLNACNYGEVNINVLFQNYRITCCPYWSFTKLLICIM